MSRRTVTRISPAIDDGDNDHDDGETDLYLHRTADRDLCGPR